MVILQPCTVRIHKIVGKLVMDCYATYIHAYGACVPDLASESIRVQCCVIRHCDVYHIHPCTAIPYGLVDVETCWSVCLYTCILRSLNLNAQIGHCRSYRYGVVIGSITNDRCVEFG